MTTDLWSPRPRASSWIGICWKCFPVPKLIIHNSSIPYLRNLETTDLASTTTSVSTVRITTCVWPSWTQLYAWRMQRVSASSCIHGEIEDISAGIWDGKQLTVALVVITTFPEDNSFSACFSRCFPRKANSSTLFSSTRKNEIQFRGIGVASVTIRRSPYPRRLLSAAFRLSFLYVSHTRWARLILPPKIRMMNGTNLWFAYSAKVLHPSGFTMWTIAAPSRIVAVADGISRTGSDADAKQVNRSLLFPFLISPPSERLGG